MITHPLLSALPPLRDWLWVRNSLCIDNQHPLAVLYTGACLQLKTGSPSSIEALNKLQNFRPRSLGDKQAQQIFFTFMMNQFPEWAPLWPAPLRIQEKEWLLNTPNGCPFATLIRTICRRLDDFSLQDVLALLPPQDQCNDRALLIEIAKMEYLFSEKQPDWLPHIQQSLPRENLFYSLALATVRRDWPTVNILLENHSDLLEHLKTIQETIPKETLSEALAFFSPSIRKAFFPLISPELAERLKTTSQLDPALLPILREKDWEKLDAFLTDCTPEVNDLLAIIITDQRLFEIFAKIAPLNIVNLTKTPPSNIFKTYIDWAINQSNPPLPYSFPFLWIGDFPAQFLIDTLTTYVTSKEKIPRHVQWIIRRLFFLLDKTISQTSDNFMSAEVLLNWSNILFPWLTPGKERILDEDQVDIFVSLSAKEKTLLTQAALAAPTPLLAYRLLYWVNPLKKQILASLFEKKFTLNEQTLEEATKKGLTDAEKQHLLNWIDWRRKNPPLSEWVCK